MRVFKVTLLVFALISCVAAQGTSESRWTTISSEKNDFVISLPSDFLVYIKDKTTSLHGGLEDMSFTITFKSTSNAEKELKPRQYDRKNQPEKTQFVKGDFKGVMYAFEKGVTLELASSKGYYSVMLNAKTVENSTMKSIVGSIKVNNEILMKPSTTPLPATENIIGVKSLKMSPEVREAFNHTQHGKIEVVYDDGPTEIKDVKRDDVAIYSAALIILKKPFARFSDAARRASMSGTVKLRILFKGDGDIGKITVVASPARELSECAVEAAKEIKFFPARIAGKPTDTSKVIEYRFWVY